MMSNVFAPSASAQPSGASEERRSVGAVVYWVTTLVVAAAFIIPGVGNLVRAPHIADDMMHLGYPAYFLIILGSWKIAGAAAVLAPRLPRLKEWAYAGMIFDLTGAAASRLMMRDGAVAIVIPLLIAALVVISWALRPAGRVLRQHDAE